MLIKTQKQSQYDIMKDKILTEKEKLELLEKIFDKQWLFWKVYKFYEKLMFKKNIAKKNDKIS